MTNSDNWSITINNGQDIARCLLYFNKISQSDYKINPLNITGISFYKQHKQVFDESYIHLNQIFSNKEYPVFEKFNISINTYLKFLIDKKIIIPYVESTIIRLADNRYLNYYLNLLNTRKERLHICAQTVNSAKYIAKECVKNNLTPEEFLTILVKTNTLAAKYISGRISLCYLAGIKNFDDLYKHMDSISQDVFKNLKEAKIAYLSKLQDAFAEVSLSKNVSVIKLTKNIMDKIKTTQCTNVILERLHLRVSTFYIHIQISLNMFLGTPHA